MGKTTHSTGKLPQRPHLWQVVRPSTPRTSHPTVPGRHYGNGPSFPEFSQKYCCSLRNLSGLPSATWKTHSRQILRNCLLFFWTHPTSFSPLASHCPHVPCASSQHSQPSSVLFAIQHGFSVSCPSLLVMLSSLIVDFL